MRSMVIAGLFGGLSTLFIGDLLTPKADTHETKYRYTLQDTLFIRGDVDGNGLLSIGDALLCFRCQFGSTSTWCICLDAMDANDNGAVSIGDCLRILRKQFVPGWQDSIPPPCCIAPADCGADPTDDWLGCEEHTCMGGVAAEQNRMRSVR